MSGSPLTTLLTPEEVESNNRIPVDYDSAAPAFDTGIVMESLAALVGGATAVALISGQPWLDVATSLQGGLGMAIGYGLGAYVQPMLTNGLPGNKSDPSEFAPYAGALLVPFAAGGLVIDKELGILVIGGFIAASISKSRKA